MVNLMRIVLTGLIAWAGLTAQEGLKWKDLGKGLLKPGFWIAQWQDDENYITRNEKGLMAHNAKSGEVRVLLDAARMEAVSKMGLSPLGYASTDADYSDLVYLHQDDIYHYSTRTAQMTRLTDTPGAEQNPTLTDDGSRLVYTRDGNIFLQQLSRPGEEIALSDDGSDTILNGHASWVYYEEILGRRSNYRAFWFSPDGDKLVFLRFDQSQVPLYPVLWFNELYGKLEMQRYPKPGTANPEVSLHLVDLTSHQSQQIDIPETAGNYLAFPMFSPYDSNLLYVQWLNRDQSKLRLYVRNLRSGSTRVAYEEDQASWVDFLESSDICFLPNEQIVLRSSRDGWFHLYRIGKKGKPEQLTQGSWSTGGIEALEGKARSLLFSAFKEDSTRSDLYRLDLGSGRIRRITKGSGHHMCRVSVGGSYFIDTVSTLSTAPVTSLVNSRTGRATLLSDSAGERFKTLSFSQPKLIRIPGPDGSFLPVVYTLPPDFQAGKRYPLILNVYGGPGARSVTDSFSRAFFYTQYLAKKGVVVVSADHRGAGHHGKIGMNAMHRRLGDVEMEDYGAVVDHFVAQGIADPERIGITGGSYGGYVTALALTRGSSRFRYGIAHFSVTDWKLYDSVYTERFMDTPQQNPKGYSQASVLEHVDGYRGGLLITHGTVDDNVHMQNTLQLVDKLQDLNKPFQMMLYPRNRHGYRGSKRDFDRNLDMDFWMRSFFNTAFHPEE